MSRAEAKRRVAEGVKFLDANYKNWIHRIRINDFNIASGCSCVIGQMLNSDPSVCKYVYGDAIAYSWNDPAQVKAGLPKGSKWLLMTQDQAEKRGFDSGGDPYVGFDDLQKEWKRVIKARLKEAK